MYLNIRRIDRDTIIIDFPKPVEVVATVRISSLKSIEARYIKHAIFKHVQKEFHKENIIDYYKEILKALDLESGLIFLTSVSMDEIQKIEENFSEIIMTVGLEPPICIDHEKVYEPLSITGTINILIYVNLPLAREAIVDLLKTAIEAKAAASSDLLLRCRSRAVGTVTDAIAIAKPYDLEEKILFSGMATTIGNNIARAVYNTIVSTGIKKGVNWMLRNCIGYDVEDLLLLFKELYTLAPIPNISIDKAIEKIRGIIYKILKDPNIWSFIIAARELDIHGAIGMIPGLAKNEYENDTVKIVADEILGLSLALYIGGAKALFSMYWVENLKKLGKLKYNCMGLYVDDIISALLGSLYTLLIEEVNRNDIDG
jgi:alpha-ribazole phosphatase CobZ